MNLGGQSEGNCFTAVKSALGSIAWSTHCFLTLRKLERVLASSPKEAQMTAESGRKRSSSSDKRGSVSHVPWVSLRPTQGAVGYVQVESKKANFLALPTEKEASFLKGRQSKWCAGPPTICT